MRGVEGVLYVLGQVREGQFASEVLRKLTFEKAEDLTLASTLVYAVLRRRELWRVLVDGFLRKKDVQLPPVVEDALLAGTAGLLELRHFAGGVLVNALLNGLKTRKIERGIVSLANAVLHSVGEQGAERMEALRRSPSLEDRALWAGIPVWSLPAWTRTWQRAELNQLFELFFQRPASTLRLSPGVDRERFLARLTEKGIAAAPSDSQDSPDFSDSPDLSGQILRLESTVLPGAVPGFDEGLCTLQSEGSIRVTEQVARLYRGGLILDMCCGRGVKAGQLLQADPDARLEGWELSEGRHRSARREIRRLFGEDFSRAELRLGSALELEPREAPSLVLLDAPCSGSGTWNRKPESKWRLDKWERLDQLASLQKKLLERAVNLCAPGGVVAYVTCSLLKQENEGIVAEVLAGHPECAELPISLAGGRRGHPLGAYLWPETPWLDGFYCAIIVKR